MSFGVIKSSSIHHIKIYRSKFMNLDKNSWVQKEKKKPIQNHFKCTSKEKFCFIWDFVFLFAKFKILIFKSKKFLLVETQSNHCEKKIVSQNYCFKFRFCKNTYLEGENSKICVNVISICSMFWSVFVVASTRFFPLDFFAFSKRKKKMYKNVC